MLNIILQSLMSSCVGFAWLYIIFLIARSTNAHIASVIGGIPSTVLVSLLSMSIIDGKQSVVSVIDYMPILLVGSYVLFTALCYMIRIYDMFVSLVISLILWVVFTMVVSFYNDGNFVTNTIIACCIVLSLGRYYLGGIDCKGVVMKIEYNNLDIMKRAFIAALVIYVTVFMSKIFGSVFGSIGASFPAVLICYLVIINKSHGVDVMIAMGRTLLYSSFCNIMLYILILKYLYSVFGIVSSTIMSVTFIIVLNVVFVFKQKLRVLNA